ncbi:MAG: cation transporter [Bacteroidetes bacterium]|nr:cation transporter [Bacteroidota bacterium]
MVLHHYINVNCAENLLKSSNENSRLQGYILLIAILLFLVKIFAWFLTGSLSILTDALESTVNIIAGAIGLYSLYVSEKPKDYDHPYGHGKAEFISAAVEGLLVTIAGLFILYSAIKNLFFAHQIIKVDIGIILITLTAVVNYLAGRICITKGRKNNSLQLISSGKHLITDTYSTGAIIFGLVLIYFTNLWFIDSVLAALVSIIIIFSGYKIVRTSIAGIMDEADVKLLENIVKLLNENRRENWIDLHNLRIIKYGARLHCDCHLTVPWYLNVREAHHEIDLLHELIKTQFHESIELFVHSDACLPQSCAICHKHDCLVRQHPFKKNIEWTIKNISQNNKHNINTPDK